MNKNIYLIGIIALLAISSVIAYTPLNYRERCEIKQSATEYRPERSFGMIGIWGRASNGEPVCFVPGNIPKKEIKPSVVVEVVPEPICEETTICTWSYKPHKLYWNHTTHWWDCKDDYQLWDHWILPSCRKQICVTTTTCTA